MRHALAAFAITMLTAGAASANAPTVFPSPSAPPPPIQVVIPAVDLSKVLGGLQGCPRVEIAPSIFVPIPCGTLKSIPTAVPSIDLAPTASPASVDLRNVGLDGPVKDQARTGVCWAFALSTTVESSLRRQGRADVLAPLHVIAADVWDDLWRGPSREAIAPEAAWPYDPIKACRFETGRDSCEQAYGVSTDSWRSDPRLVSERERAKAYGVVAFAKAQRLKNASFGDSAVAALARGQALFLQLGIDTSAWSYRNLRGGVIGDYDGTDGGHAVTVVGYRLTPSGRQFLLHNSWGTGWGERGYAWIAEATVQKHIRDVVLVDGLLPGQPPPAPPVVATPSRPIVVPTGACAAGSVFDVGAGTCAAPCPSGLAPAFGRCWLG